MNSLVMNGLDYVVNSIVQWLVWLFSVVADGIAHLAVTETHLPWVVNVRASVEAVGWLLLGIAIAYKVWHQYVMFNEGTADPEGSVLGKDILRTIIYMALSGTVATLVFRFGIDLAAVIAATPMLKAAQSFHGLAGNVAAVPGTVVGLPLALTVVLLIGVIMLIVVSVQMSIRATQLVIYVIAAPIAALGQLNAGGGTWSTWWTKLVVLSLSQAVQILCFMGLVGTTQVLTSKVDTKWIAIMMRHMPIAAPVAMTASVAMMVVNTIFALLLMIGWLVTAIRGPHLLEQWSYHSGVGGGVMYVGSAAGRKVGEGAGSRIASRLGLGK